MGFNNISTFQAKSKYVFHQGLNVKDGNIVFLTTNADGYLKVNHIYPVAGHVTLYTGLSVGGSLSAVLDTTVTGVTQTGTDSSTKIATTQFVYDAIPHTDLHTTVKTNSGSWGGEQLTVSYNVLTANSGNWDSVYSQVQAESGKWIENRDDISEVAAASGSWNSVYTTNTARSASWDSAHSSLTATSGSWDSTFTTVNGNSADWNYVASNSAKSDISELQSNSANWNAAHTDVKANSANWSEAYSNHLTGASFNTGDGVLTFTQKDGGTVTVDIDGRYATDTAGVNATSVYTTTKNNSGVWNSTASVVTGSSANWDTTYTSVCTQSGYWDSSFTLLTSYSAGWDDGVSVVAANSANWNTGYNNAVNLTDIKANSASWNSVYTHTNLYSADWESTHTDVNASSSNWDSTHTNVNANSAVWQSVANEVTGTSADWNYVASNSATLQSNTTIAGTLSTQSTLSAAALDVAGDINVDQKIIHKGDTNTFVNFRDDRFSIHVGGIVYLDCDDSGSAPHDFTVNDGSNNVDFIVKGNGSNLGNPLFKTDASTGRVGINGIGSPEAELEVDGTILATGSDPRIGIGMTAPGEALTVSGNISASGIVYALGGSSTVWNQTYSDVSANSATWVSTYSIVSANSASWNSGGGGSFDSSELQANSGSWNSVYTSTNSNSANWDATHTDVNANSSKWTEAYSNHLTGASFNSSDGVLTFTQKDGGTVTVDIDGRFLEGTGTQNFLPIWSSTPGALADSSLYFNAGRLGVNTSDVSIALTVSGAGTNEASISARDVIYAGNSYSTLWAAAYTTVNTYSGGWGDAALQANSGNWDSTYTTVSTYSANWNATHTDVNANSATWTWVAQNSATIYGDLSARADILLSEDQRIYFEADKGTWIESSVSDAFRIVADNSQMLILDYDTGNRAVFGNGTKVYIGSNNNALPSNELEVAGAVSALGVIYASGGDSTAWNDTRTTLQDVSTTLATSSGSWADNAADITNIATTSANWDSTHSTVNTYSADWNWVAQNSATGGGGGGDSHATSTLSAYSANWETTYNLVSAGSANWNATHLSVNTYSGNWDSSYTNLSTNSSNWENTYTTLSTESGDWENTYSTVNTTSSTWESTYTQLSTYSANWDTTYTLMSTYSANWNSTHTNVNTQSGYWTGVYTTVQDNSSSWGGGGGDSHTTSTVSAYSASWNYPLSSRSVLLSVTYSNSFSAGQAIRKVGTSDYGLATALSATSADVIGIVTEATSSQFIYAHTGLMLLSAHGLTVGNSIFLSHTVPGEITITEPDQATNVSKPLGIVIDSDHILVQPLRGMIVPESTDLTSAAGWTDTGTLVHTTSTSDFVSIGTTASGEKLTVAGNISAQGNIYSDSLTAANITATAGLTAEGGLSVSLFDHGNLTGTSQTIIPEFSAGNIQTAVASAALVINSTNNRAVGSSITLRVSAYNTSIPITWNSSWSFIGTKPTVIPADKYALISLQCFGTTEADIIAAVGFSS